MILVDAHADLAYNMLAFRRDYLRSAYETRQLEADSDVTVRNGISLVGWPEYQRGQVALVFGTLFATPARLQRDQKDSQTYATTEQAHQLYSAQLDLYERLEDDHPDKFRLVRTRADLELVLKAWEQGEDAPAPMQAESEEERRELEKQRPPRPVGIVVLMEGAEAVRLPEELEMWWQRGVRLVGPAWGATRFSGGTDEPGPLTHEGRALLEVMGDLGFSLDISHMDAPAALEAVEEFPGPVVATHSNAAALVKDTSTNRHLTDRQIAALIERDGVVGIIPLNSFLKAGWRRGDRRQEVGLDRVVAQIDYVCQMAGDALHAGIGSDFDGGFGLQSVPEGIDTVADLRKLIPLLAERGYSDEDVACILGGNWLRILRRSLPE